MAEEQATNQDGSTATKDITIGDAGMLDLSYVYDLPVQITVVLGKASMNINQLLKLSRGSVVELNRNIGDPIDVYVNNKLVARGEVVIVEERIGITITEITKDPK